jgi:hypothetical protein
MAPHRLQRRSTAEAQSSRTGTIMAMINVRRSMLLHIISQFLQNGERAVGAHRLREAFVSNLGIVE